MPRALSAGLILKKNALDPQSAWLELYQIVASDTQTLYLANHPTNVVYEGHEYLAYPIRHDQLREEATGGLQKFTVHVPNVLRDVQAFLEYNDGLRGKRVTLILVNLDDLTLGDLRSTFIVEATSVTEQVASFVLGKPIPVNEIRLPLRLINRDLFPALPTG